MAAGETDLEPTEEKVVTLDGRIVDVWPIEASGKLA
jgi:hypothetical protein